MNDTYKLRVNLTVERYNTGNYQGERLSVNEELDLTADTFVDIAKILGQFQDLTKAIRQQ